MKTFTIQRVSIFSMFKFGVAAGMLFSIIPNLIAASTIWKLISLLVGWLNTLADYSLSVPLMGEIEVDVVDFLQLNNFLFSMQSILAWGWIRVILWTLGLTVLVGVWVGLTAIVMGAIFNLISQVSGGLQIDLSEHLIQELPNKHDQTVLDMRSFTSDESGPRLEIIAPIQRIIHIPTRTALIGSGSDCNIQLDGLLPKHARITYENGRYLLHNLSQEKIIVQGHIVEEVNMLRNDFVLQIRIYKMVFRE